MSTLASRVQKAFDPNRHTKAELARKARVKAPSVNAWFSGDTLTLKAEPLVRAAAYLEVNALWLATGEGPMRAALTAAEPAAAYQRPPWPFPGLQESEICSLDRDTILRLEGAMLITAQAVGVQVGNRRAA
jgi:transcriptional regulator with XRE-family HTH domain